MNSRTIDIKIIPLLSLQIGDANLKHTTYQTVVCASPLLKPPANCINIGAYTFRLQCHSSARIGRSPSCPNSSFRHYDIAWISDRLTTSPMNGFQNSKKLNIGNLWLFCCALISAFFFVTVGSRSIEITQRYVIVLFYY